jgi:hypothetical protein
MAGSPLVCRTPRITHFAFCTGACGRTPRWQFGVVANDHFWLKWPFCRSMTSEHTKALDMLSWVYGGRRVDTFMTGRPMHAHGRAVASDIRMPLVCRPSAGAPPAGTPGAGRRGGAPASQRGLNAGACKRQQTGYSPGAHQGLVSSGRAVSGRPGEAPCRVCVRGASWRGASRMQACCGRPSGRGAGVCLQASSRLGRYAQEGVIHSRVSVG